MTSKQSDTRKEPWPLLVLSCVLGLCGLAAILVGLYFLIKGDATQAATGVGCGVVLLLLATVDRFEVIKGIGIEAKTRDLSRKIDDAEAILGKIQDITVAFAPSLLSVAANAGRIAGTQPPEMVYKLARDSQKLMTAAGVDHEKVREALAPWSSTAAQDLARDIVFPVQAAAKRRLASLNESLRITNGVHLLVGSARDRAIDEVDKTAPYAKLMKTASEWPTSECAIELRRIADTLPGAIPADVADAFRADVTAWAPELEHLAWKDDFRSPGLWFERISDAHRKTYQ